MSRWRSISEENTCIAHKVTPLAIWMVPVALIHHCIMMRRLGEGMESPIPLISPDRANDIFHSLKDEKRELRSVSMTAVAFAMTTFKCALLVELCMKQTNKQTCLV